MSATTPSEAVSAQHVTISQAIQLLQNELDSMTDGRDPDDAVIRTESWQDVSKYAHIADMARGIIARFEEE